MNPFTHANFYMLWFLQVQRWYVSGSSEGCWPVSPT